MPKFHPIEGGQDTKAPPDWNEAELGPCQTVSVFYREQAGMPTVTTACTLTPAELQALQEGGVMFHTIYGALKQPPVAIWVQDEAGNVIAVDQEPRPAPPPPGGTGQAFTAIDPGARLLLGMEALCEELLRQAEGDRPAPTIGEMDEAGQVWLHGTFNLKEALEAALEACMPAGANGLVELPVLTLGGLAAEHQVARHLESLRHPHPDAPPAEGLEEHKTAPGVAEAFAGNAATATPAEPPAEDPEQ